MTSTGPSATVDAYRVLEGIAAWEFDDLMCGARGPGSGLALALDVVGDALADAATARRDANRAMARYVDAVREAMQVARANPHVYLTPEGLQARDAVELAERAAATDAALQLSVTPSRVRGDAGIGRLMQTQLPQLWASFRAGAIGYGHARAAVDAVAGIVDPLLLTRFDDRMAGIGDAAEGVFASRAEVLPTSCGPNRRQPDMPARWRLDEWWWNRPKTAWRGSTRSCPRPTPFASVHG